MHHSIRYAAPSDLAAAARTLAVAFDQYPWTRWSISEDGYAARLQELQSIYLCHALTHGLVLVDDAVASVGAFLPTDAPEPDASTRARIAELHGDRLDRLAGADLPQHPGVGWSLATLGVRPHQSGKGLGSAIIEKGLHEIDRNGSVVGLETSDERNVRLYRRHGFVKTATTQIPNGPVVFSMIRHTPNPNA